MEEQLLSVIEEYQINSVIKLADLLGITMRYVVMAKEIGGLYYNDDILSEIIIAINSDIDEQLQLFVCAYLIAHHALSKGTHFCFLNEKNTEITYYLLAMLLLRATLSKVVLHQGTMTLN